MSQMESMHDTKQGAVPTMLLRMSVRSGAGSASA